MIFPQLVAKIALCSLLLKLDKGKLYPGFSDMSSDGSHHQQIRTPSPLAIEVLAQLTRYAVKLTHSIRLNLQTRRRMCFLLCLIH